MGRAAYDHAGNSVRPPVFKWWHHHSVSYSLN
jgi:hypothetical protein